MLIFRRIHFIHEAYVTVTLYESSWWPVGTHSSCVPTGHHEISQRVTVTCIQCILLKMSIYGSKHVEEYFINKKIDASSW